MTDAEPEPFRMSTSADDERDDDDRPAPDDASGSDAATPDTESISDLIDEASRTAAEQAEREAAGTAPEDRSADVWGRPDDEDDLDAVWSAAAERHRGSHVFDDMLGTEASWSSPTRATPPAAPTSSTSFEADAASSVEDEPEVFKLAIRDDDDAGMDDDALDPAPPATEAPPAPEAAAAAAPDAAPPVGGPSAADAPADDAPADDAPVDEPPADDAWATEVGGHLDDETWGPVLDDADDAWASADEAGDPWGAATEATPSGDEPEPFQFAAGPETSAPAPVPDHVDLADEDEPDLFAFAFEAGEEPVADEEPVGGEDDAVGPADEEDDDAPVTFDLGWDEDDDGGEAEDDDEDPFADEPPLAETARPRADVGWEDQSTAQDSWSLDGVTVPRADDGFGADDEPISSHEPDPPFQTESQALGDVLDDLLGDMAPPAAAADDDGDDVVGELDGMPPPIAHDRADDGTTTPAIRDLPPPVPVGLDDEDLEAADDSDGEDLEELAATTTVASGAPEEDGDDEDAGDDEPVAPPTPPTAPAAMSFSSKPKKRGLFRS